MILVNRKELIKSINNLLIFLMNHVKKIIDYFTISFEELDARCTDERPNHLSATG